MSRLREIADWLLKSILPKFSVYHCDDECDESCEDCTNDWIEAEAQVAGLSRDKVQRLKSLTKMLMEIIKEESLSLRPPQVDGDGEGDVGLVWARRKPPRTLVFNVNERNGIDAMLVDGRRGVDRYDITRKDVAEILSWYVGKTDDMGMRKEYDFSDGERGKYVDPTSM